MKTNQEGKAVLDVIPVGDTVRLQVIVEGYQTFAMTTRSIRIQGNPRQDEAAFEAVTPSTRSMMIRCRVVRRANRKMLRQSRTAVEQFFTGLADRKFVQQFRDSC